MVACSVTMVENTVVECTRLNRYVKLRYRPNRCSALGNLVRTSSKRAESGMRLRRCTSKCNPDKTTMTEQNISVHSMTKDEDAYQNVVAVSDHPHTSFDSKQLLKSLSGSQRWDINIAGPFIPLLSQRTSQNSNVAFRSEGTWGDVMLISFGKDCFPM